MTLLTAWNLTGKEIVMSKKKRTSQGLRDILFDEIEQIRGPDGDPTRAMAVANLAKQIINVAKVELDFHREAVKHAEAGNPLNLGNMTLGSSETTASAEKAVTEH